MAKPSCKCGMIAKYAADPRTAIYFDEKMGEFYLITDNPEPGAFLILAYCFHCGDSLPQSKRHSLFSEPDEAFVEELELRLNDSCSIGDVVQELGDPDEEYEPPPLSKIDQEVYGMKTTIRQLSWRHLSATTEVTVNEYADGTYAISIGGKYTQAGNAIIDE